jgi:hypothetical protein
MNHAYVPEYARNDFTTLDSSVQACYFDMIHQTLALGYHCHCIGNALFFTYDQWVVFRATISISLNLLHLAPR